MFSFPFFVFLFLNGSLPYFGFLISKRKSIGRKVHGPCGHSSGHQLKYLKSPNWKIYIYNIQDGIHTGIGVFLVDLLK